MNREDRAKFLALITDKQPALLAGVDQEHITDEQIMALVAQAMTPPPALVVEALPGGATGQPATPGVPADVLAAVLARQEPPLRYQDHAQVKVEEGGVERTRWQTTWRPLTAADIIASRDAGTAYVLVAGDGRKYEFAK